MKTKNRASRKWRLVFFALFTLCSIGSFAQEDSKTIDLSYISHKAKLLTLSEIGLTSPDTTLHYLQKQASTISYSYDSAYLMIKITSEKEHFIQLNKELVFTHYCTETSECDFFIVFSKYSNRFFKIASFEYSNFSELYKECKDRNISIYSVFLNSGDGKSLINVDCYIKKYIKHRKRLKCFDNCNKCTAYVVY